jgi:hypothetical protein
VNGGIRDASNGLVYTKGFQVSDDQGYRAQKVKTFTTTLELWSQQRDEAISQANLNVARSLMQVPNLPIDSFLDVWLFYPSFGSFIYMPGARYRSPYGYSYLSVAQGNYYWGGSVASGGSNRGGFSNGASTANSGGSSSSGGGGGGSSVGFSSAAPASTGASAPAPSAGAQAGAGGGHTATLGK